MTQVVADKSKVAPFSLKDAPALIEKAWPTAKISAEKRSGRRFKARH